MSPKNEITNVTVASETVENGKLTVKLPGKKDMPKTNDEAQSRFPQAITHLLEKLANAEADDKKAIRRSLRKLGYKLADARERGMMTLEL